MVVVADDDDDDENPIMFLNVVVFVFVVVVSGWNAPTITGTTMIATIVRLRIFYIGRTKLYGWGVRFEEQSVDCLEEGSDFEKKGEITSDVNIL